MNHFFRHCYRYETGALGALICFLFAAVAQAEETDPGTLFFRDSIEPILKEHCFECHSHEADKSKGGLMVDSAVALKTGGNSGAVIEPGNPDDSLLFRAVSYLEEDMEMPPKTRLSEKQVADIRKWIELGAPDPRVHELADKKPPQSGDLWSLQPVENPDAPDVGDTNWPRSDVDRFVLARLEHAQLKPVADASPLKIIRRLHFDLTGMPPTPEAVSEFLQALQAAEDQESEKVRK